MSGFFAKTMRNKPQCGPWRVLASAMSLPYILLVNSERRYERLAGRHLLASGFRFASASSNNEARRLTLIEVPSVLMADLDHDPRSSVRFLNDLRRRAPQVKVLWVTAHLDAAEIEKVRAGGANGLLFKDADGPTTVRALRTLCAGGEFFEEDQPTRKRSEIRALSMDERIEKLIGR